MELGFLLLKPARLILDRYVGFLENMDKRDFVENFVRITMPLLNSYGKFVHLVPPEACERLTRAVGSEDTEDICLNTDHIGSMSVVEHFPFVGRLGRVFGIVNWSPVFVADNRPLGNDVHIWLSLAFISCS